MSGSVCAVPLDMPRAGRHNRFQRRGDPGGHRLVGEALVPPRAVGIAAQDVVGYIYAVESVLDSFETREEYLEDIPVADTVLVLQALAARRGIASELSSPLLPATSAGA